MHWRIQSSSFYMLVLLLSILLWPSTNVNARSYAVSGEISGVVYVDYNANGRRDVGEPGVANVDIIAVDEYGISVSAQTNVDGSYNLTSADDGLRGHVRIEFLPSDASFDAYETAPAGGTSVQFANIDTGMTDVNAGIYIPHQSCGGDPLLFTTCFVFGDQFEGKNVDGAVAVAIPFGASGTNPPKTHMPPAHQMGSTYGVAVQNANQRIFTSSYIKTHTGLGPGAETDTTTGGIYEVFRDERGVGASAQLFIDLNALGFDTGDDPHPLPTDLCEGAAEEGETNLNCWMHDVDTFPMIGKLGFGDLDFSPDQTMLYVVNLNTRQLIELSVGVPATVPDVDDILAYDIPSADCADNDAVPFGLGNDGESMYIGVTCTAESSRDRNDLQAIVYKFDRGDGPGTESYEQVVTIDLTYSRVGDLTSWCRMELGGIIKTNSLITLQGPEGCPTNWHVWTNNWDDFAMTRVDSGKFLTPIAPQPMLSDIDFDGPDMLIAFRDRTADQFGNRVGNPTDSTDAQLYEGVSAGELLRACLLSNGTYLLEEDGMCGGVPGGSMDNQEGPGIGEYYFDERVIEQDFHQELFMGAIVQIDGRSEVASTVTAPLAFNEAGIGNWNNLNGTQQTHARLYQTASRETLFGKANGLGDLEAICALPSLELGNRVWCDSDQDGIQSPDEAGIPLQTVTLNCGGNDVTTLTDQAGQYLFTDLKYGSENDGAIIPRSADCTISVEFGGQTGEEIASFCGFADATQLTGTDVEGDSTNSPLADIRDSDAVADGTLAMVSVTTGENGQNNHGLDIGFTSDTVLAAPTPISPTPVATTAAYDAGADDEGIVEDDITVEEDVTVDEDTSDQQADVEEEPTDEPSDVEEEPTDEPAIEDEATATAEPIEPEEPEPQPANNNNTAVQIAAGVSALGALGIWGWRRRGGASY